MKYHHDDTIRNTLQILFKYSGEECKLLEKTITQFFIAFSIFFPDFSQNFSDFFICIHFSFFFQIFFDKCTTNFQMIYPLDPGSLMGNIRIENEDISDGTRRVTGKLKYFTR